MKNNVLIILGMHRSGTSLAAQWISSCGLNLGDRMMGASIGNVKGHCEDLDFHDLHESIFEANNIRYGGFHNINSLSLNNYHIGRLRSLVDLKSNLRPQWGWKEPRTTLFANYYHKCLIDSSLNVSYLILHRRPDNVIDSLLRRLVSRNAKFLMSRGQSSKLWYRLRKRFVDKKIRKDHFDDYIDSWIIYTKSLLEFMNSIDDDNFYVVSNQGLLKQSEDVFSWLSSRGFNLSYNPIDKVFDGKMIDESNLILNLSQTQRHRVDLLYKEIQSYERVKSQDANMVQLG